MPTLAVFQSTLGNGKILTKRDKIPVSTGITRDLKEPGICKIICKSFLVASLGKCTLWCVVNKL